MLRCLRIALLGCCWMLLLPGALALSVLMSIPRILLAVPHLLELCLDVVWLALAVCFHLVHSSLFAIGLSGREKTLQVRGQVRHFSGEVAAGLLRLGRIPWSILSDSSRMLRLGQAWLRRLVRSPHAEDRRPSSDEQQGSRLESYGFEDRYEIVERLPQGGSTARVFVVKPRRVDDQEKRVLKLFDLTLGSHLESMIRESGAVQLATRLGIVLDSRMTGTSFYYVMPYYPGVTLTRQVSEVHRPLGDGSSPGGSDLARFLVWLRDLLAIIVAYHEQGVFHKDIKPDNLIVGADGLHLIDIGLLTPLESALQLTTHGTECFRDPEMVKLASRGTPIRDVNCAKLDIYSIGAVFHFMLEGSFPASGSLSRFTRPIPFCLRWVSSRAMADFDKRYASAREMLRDVEELQALSVKTPLDAITVSSLPSFREIPAEAVGAAPPVLLQPAASAADLSHPRSRFSVRSPAVIRVFLVLAFLAAASVGFALANLSGWRLTGIEGDLQPGPAAAATEEIYREFLEQDGAVAWVVERIGRFRSADGVARPAHPPVRLKPAIRANEPGTGEFLRELKLALAHRGIPFEVPALGERLEEGSEGACALIVDAAPGETPRRIDLTLEHPGGATRWRVVYP